MAFKVVSELWEVAAETLTKCGGALPLAPSVFRRHQAPNLWRENHFIEGAVMSSSNAAVH